MNHINAAARHWHVCRDGLTPIIETVHKIADPDAADLVEWFRDGAGVSFGLRARLTRVTSKSWTSRTPETRQFRVSSTRREIVRRWLQSNGYEADAREFDSRLTELIDHLQKWERGAKQEAQDRESTWKAKDEAGEFLELVFIIGQTGCDALHHFTEEASDTWNYLEQLNSTIRAKLEDDADQPADAETEPRPPNVRVDVEAGIVTVDERPIALRGGASVKERVAKFIDAMIEADGEYVKRPENIKTAQVENQPEEIKSLIDAQPGAGSRIPREKLRRS